jgi:peptidoglycan/xylan/chitin deacetylase (PgdA/CDA1 family)
VRRILLGGFSLIGLLSVIPITHAQDFTLRRIRVPILMYHYIGELPEDADVFRVNLTISSSQFRDHLQYLTDNNYTTISFYDLEQALRDGTSLPDKPVILTFDDGHLDHYTNAFPVLKQFGMTGTFFLVTGRIDAGDPAYMTWEQASEMRNAGMSMEPHTKNHPDLSNREEDYLVYEIVGSMESIQSHVGNNPAIFSYPGGRYDDNTLRVLEMTGVIRAVTTEFGNLHTTDNTLLMPRLRISNDTSVPGLAHLLSLTG